MRFFLAVMIGLTLMVPLPAFAVDQADLLQKIEDLSRELEKVKQQMQEMQKKDEAKEQRITKVEKKADAAKKPSWLEISGDYRFRADSLKGKVQDHMNFGAFETSLKNNLWNPAVMGGPGIANGPAGPYVPSSVYDPTGSNLMSAMNSAMTNGYTVKNDIQFLNRFGLNIKARATEDITVKARLLMYKTWGNNEPDQNPFFADKFVLMDGNVGHLPEDNTLRVDQAFATWTNIAGQPLWFSVGRRPSTGGVPTNIRQNVEKSGSSGVPGLLVDYAFDGLTLGYAPDIDKLPGAYAKFCYGMGMDSGFRPDNDRFKDVQFIGVNVVPYDTDNLHLELQWQRGSSIFAFPGSEDPFGLGAKNKNIGDIDWWGAVAMGKIEKLGYGDLNLFATGSISRTHPNNNMYGGDILYPAGDFDGDMVPDVAMVHQDFGGLLFDPGKKESHTGSAIYLGARYDILKTGTKIGFEYNHGSKYWMAFTPASDDLWTSKLATRGNVYEGYIIQEIKNTPVSKLGKAFFRLGFQHYDFDYTGSGFWIGEPRKISELKKNDPQMLKPLRSADDIYLTFDVYF